MKEWIDVLSQIIDTTVKEWTIIPKADWVKKTQPEKWSKAEVVGHLIDSAQNNIQRFIRAQYEGAPNHFYNQNEQLGQTLFSTNSKTKSKSQPTLTSVKMPHYKCDKQPK